MLTKKFCFRDIFEEYDSENDEVIERSVVIPIIQRDYAQGRKDESATRIREKFLLALKGALMDGGTPITLDFIYGGIDDKNVVTLLDGQQRVTTLFLLHWYFAKKENIESEKYAFLYRFSYETRYSSRDFCRSLIAFEPDLQEEAEAISEQIENQPWFPLDWKKDPTISSMLNMLDAIDEMFKDGVNDGWGKLTFGAVSFYFLPIEDMGLTDELYIKMNSRGKPLTDFENFKSEFEDELEKIDAEVSNRIAHKIDNEWTDLLWEQGEGKDFVDEGFLKYFHFICQALYYKQNESAQKKSFDNFELLKELFSTSAKNNKENIEFFETAFDCLVMIKNEYGSLENFFDSFVSDHHEIGKIKVTKHSSNNLFKDYLNSVKNSLTQFVLLYAFIVYLSSREKNDITVAQFSRRIRIVNNLIKNSPDEMSDSEDRIGGNRMPAILKQVDSIILSGVIDAEIELSFNSNQLQEESEKIEWVDAHLDEAETLFRLEDHELLYGQISIVGLENVGIFNKFEELFRCNRNKVNKALLTIGDYFQEEARYTSQYQLGCNNNLSWSALFHRSAMKGFEKTKEVLVRFLSSYEKFSDDMLDEIVEQYIDKCESERSFPWQYYYLKYAPFNNPKEYEYYKKDFWGKYKKPGYECIVIVTKKRESEYAYDPFIYAAYEKIEDKHGVARDFRALRVGRIYIINCQDAIVVREALEEDGEEWRPDREIGRFEIEQNFDGIDQENRIDKIVEVVKRYQ